MTGPSSLAAEVERAEQRLALRRSAAAAHARLLADRARRRLSSPAVLMGAAGVGFLLASRKGRRTIAKAFAGVRLALTLLSVARG
jgi:hypothetical protein